MWQIITIKCLILKRLPIQLTTANKSYTSQQRHLNSTRWGCFGSPFRRQSTKWECFGSPVRRQSTKWGCFGSPVRRQSTKWGCFEHFRLPQKTSAFHIHPRYCLATQHHLFFLQSYATQRWLLLPRVFFIICCVMTKFTQIPQPLERYPCSEISLPIG